MKTSPFSRWLFRAAVLLWLGLTGWMCPAVAQETDEDVRRKYDACFLEAIRQKEKGADDAAYELLDYALRLRPDAPEALYEMARLYLRNFPNERLEACRLLEKAASLDTTNAFIQESLAELYLYIDSLPAAIRLYERMTTGPNANEALLHLLAIYEQMQNHQGTISVLDRLERREGKSDAISRERYKTYLAMNDKARAMRELRALCEEYPGDLRYRLLVADFYMQTDCADSAYAVYQEVLAKEPDNGYARLSLMNYYAALGNDSLYRLQVDSIVLNPQLEPAMRAEAIRSLVQTTERNGGDSLQVIQLFRRIMEQPQVDLMMADLFQGYMLLKKVPTDSIVPVWERMLTIEPEYDGARLQLLEYYIKKEKLAETAALCSEGVHFVPEQLVYYYYGAAAYSQLEQTDKALELLEKGRTYASVPVGEEEDPARRKLPSDMFALLGDLYHEAGRKDESYAAYDKALEILPDNILCLNNYAYFLSLDGRQLDKAEAMSLKTIEAEPQNPTYLDTYAWVLFVQGKYEMARNYIDETLKYLSETPENAGIFEHAGDIYARLGRTADALGFWKKAQALGGDSELLQRKIKHKKYFEK